MRKLFICGAVVMTACGDGTGPKSGTSGISLGETRLVSDADRSSIKIDGGASGGEYLLVPFLADSFYVNNTRNAQGDLSDSTKRRVQITVSASGTQTITGPPSPALQPGSALFSRAASGGDLTGTTAATRFHVGLRQAERRLMARIGSVSQGAHLDPAVRPATVATSDVPALGSVKNYNTNAADGAACTPRVDRPGRVVAITTRAVIVADTTNPAGGFTDAEYAQLGKQFDDLVYDVDATNFGTPGDLDANGRVLIFFTSAVNGLTQAGDNSYVGGFFYGRDLFPAASCAGSNVAEMFYMLVPDPVRAGGNVDSPFSKTRVASQTIGVLAHEFQHLINLSTRKLQSDEDIWLNEGLSHVAEELLFYKVSGLQTKTNVTVSQIAPPGAQAQTFLDYQNSNFNRLNSYLRDPEQNSPYADNDELTTRGAVWQLLRYLADRKGGDQAATFRSLVNTNLRGLRNLQSVFGQDALALVRDWSVAQYADDASIAAVDARYTHPSWNYRAIFPRYSTNAGAFPLKTRALGAAPVPLTLVGGGAAYFRFAVAPNTTATINSTLASGAAVPTSLQMTVLRTK